MPTPSSSSRPQTSSGIRGWIKKLGPYQSLFLLLIPITLVEPMKLVALAVAGKGHWIAGTGMIVIAYAGSLFIVERLFRLVKPKLLEIYWFARLWAWFIIIREKTLGWFARFIPFYPLMKQERPRGWSSDPARTEGRVRWASLTNSTTRAGPHMMINSGACSKSRALTRGQSPLSLPEMFPPSR